MPEGESRFAHLFWALLALAAVLFPARAEAVKTLRITFQVAESGFDPVKVSDYYSGTVIEAIFDPLLTYDYLARPPKLVPNVTEALPTISEDGRTYTLKLRPGIF